MSEEPKNLDALDDPGQVETQEREPVVQDGAPIVAGDHGVSFLTITLPVGKEDGKKAEWKPGDIVWRPKGGGDWRRWDGGNVDPSHLTKSDGPAHLAHRSGVVTDVNEHVATVLEHGTVNTGKNGALVPNFAKGKKIGLLHDNLKEAV
jgi:hypothetical protein